MKLPIGTECLVLVKKGYYRPVKIIGYRRNLILYAIIENPDRSTETVDACNIKPKLFLVSK
jgi:hypothetical protein